MLVKFLSYAASVIGARRYKPMFVSLAVLICLITGVTALATTLANSEKNVSSVQRQKSPASQQKASASSSELQGLQRQEAKPSAGPQNSDASTPDTNPADSKPEPVAGQPVAGLDITLGAATVTLNSTGLATLTAANPEGAALTWSLTADSPANGLLANLAEPSKDKEAASALIRFRTDNATAGSYQFTLTAKDSTRGLSISKIITVVVPPAN